jgi:anti-anti-sigma factor
MPGNVTFDSAHGNVVLRLHGEFDIANEGALLSALSIAERTGKPTVIDLDATTFMDIACVRHLHRAKQQKGRQLQIVHPPWMVRRVAQLMEFAGMDDVVAADSES